jgi:hypothetical protein
MYESLSPDAVPTKHTRGRLLCRERLSTKSSSILLRGSIEKPPPPIATICRTAIANTPSFVDRSITLRECGLVFNMEVTAEK